MNQKVITIMGTRPEIIRTSRICPKLDECCNHVIVHTNQNFTTTLKDIFFDQLELRQPDYVMTTSMADTGLTHTDFRLARQLADMFPQIEDIFKKEKPDKVLILGDTNSALCAIIAERMGIPVYHMEAANRSFNRTIPEEVNRVLIDSIASYNLFYTPTNRHTLMREGKDPKRIFQCGNPTMEVLNFYNEKINKSYILKKLGIEPWDDSEWASYFLVDIHRQENINDGNRLLEILLSLNKLAEIYKIPVIFNIHPSTKSKIERLNIKLDKHIKCIDSFGFFDWVKLEKYARVGLTDSGLCSEEYCIMKVPCVIVRNETERPEVVEAGGAIISGISVDSIIDAVSIMIKKIGTSWAIPDGYDHQNVSERVVNYILSTRQ